MHQHRPRTDCQVKIKFFPPFSTPELTGNGRPMRLSFLLLGA